MSLCLVVDFDISCKALPLTPATTFCSYLIMKWSRRSNTLARYIRVVERLNYLNKSVRHLFYKWITYNVLGHKCISLCWINAGRPPSLLIVFCSNYCKTSLIQHKFNDYDNTGLVHNKKMGYNKWRLFHLCYQCTEMWLILDTYRTTVDSHSHLNCVEPYFCPSIDIGPSHSASLKNQYRELQL